MHLAMLRKKEMFHFLVLEWRYLQNLGNRHNSRNLVELKLKLTRKSRRFTSSLLLRTCRFQAKTQSNFHSDKNPSCADFLNSRVILTNRKFRIYYLVLTLDPSKIREQPLFRYVRRLLDMFSQVKWLSD